MRVQLPAAIVAVAMMTVAVIPASAQTVAPLQQEVDVSGVSPERLTVARAIVSKLVPPGVYKTVMASAMEPVIGSMGDSMKALPLRQIAAMGGLNQTDAAALEKVDVEAVMAIYDPHWRERSELTMRAMIASMGGFFTTLEPQLREAYAQAYARKFNLDELKSLSAFFATPAGEKFAAGYMTIAADPAVAAEMKTMMPKMMQQMPAFMEAAKKATANLPPVRPMTDLTHAERTKLAKALGVPEAQLKDAK